MIWYFMLFPFVPLAIYFVYHYWPRSREARFHYLHRELTNDMRRRGLSAHQQIDEMKFRHAWARLRRRASEATLAWPSGYQREIARIATDEANGLALIDRAVAKRFLGVVNTAPLGDILYPEAMAAAQRAMKETVDFGVGKISDDHLASVTRR